MILLPFFSIYSQYIFWFIPFCGHSLGKLVSEKCVQQQLKVIHAEAYFRQWGVVGAVAVKGRNHVGCSQTTNPKNNIKRCAYIPMIVRVKLDIPRPVPPSSTLR